MIAMLNLIPLLLSTSQGLFEGQKLWYQQPAANWNEALPVGNGRLGAMIFGGIEEERLQLNDNTLWAGHVEDRNNPKALAALPEIRRLIFEGKNQEASDLASKTMMGVPPTIQSYQLLGNLHLAQANVAAANDYRRWLQLDTATAGCHFIVGSTHFVRETFASHPDGVLISHLTAQGPQPIELEIRLDRPENGTTVAVGEDGLHMSGRAGKDGVLYDAFVKLKTDGSITHVENRLVLRGAHEVTLALASATNYNFADPSRPLEGDRMGGCEGLVNRALARPYQELVSRHVRDFQSLFARVSLSLGDSKAEVPTDRRLDAVRAGQSDPALAALYFQFGPISDGLLLATRRHAREPTGALVQ